jgi:Zn finger protein HypA/HybF involved in hydrogenase expression
MARKRDAEFFECHACEKVTLLTNRNSKSTCPGCGSATGRVVLSSQLKSRIEEGAVFSIDLSPGRRDKPKP